MDFLSDVSWLYMYMPIAGVDIFWPGLLLIGFSVGVIGGFFGMGGAWMVTPGLNILGFPMAFAIGTDIAHIAGKSMISTMRHSKFGNVDYRLGFIMLIGTMVGIELGAQLVMMLERIGKHRPGGALGLCGVSDPHRLHGVLRLLQGGAGAEEERGPQHTVPERHQLGTRRCTR